MKLSLNVGLAWPEVEDVYSVGYRGQTVGKIWFATDRRTESSPWEWHLCIPMTLPDDTKGAAQSKADALQALANSLYALIVRTEPERLARAFRFAKQTGLNFEQGEELELTVVENIVSPANHTEQAEITSPVPVAGDAGAAAAALLPEVAQPPRPKQVITVGKKRIPTVTVKLGATIKGGAQADIPRSALTESRSDQSTLPPLTDAKSLGVSGDGDPRDRRAIPARERPIAVVPALAALRPKVATDADGLPETVRAGSVRTPKT